MFLEYSMLGLNNVFCIIYSFGLHLSERKITIVDVLTLSDDIFDSFEDAELLSDLSYNNLVILPTLP
ncbi:MAG: hypothetical protein N3F64_06955 [Nitrososphaeria archaeon]|nr:hypothetical protein [Nitrososphaeria archaeon]